MRRRRLSLKYAMVLVALVTVMLLVSGAVEIWSGYQESRAALVALQREKARGAAGRIEGFVKEIERQLGWTTHPQVVSGAAAIQQRRIDSFRLLRQVPPIMELSYLDRTGRELLRLSRLAMEVVGSQTDYSGDARFREAHTGRTWFGPVYFRKESEPYLTIAMLQSGGGVTVAEVNLKFIWDVVSQIKVGRAGLAYAVDSAGNLIAHPDISLVLQKTNLSGLRQVRAALEADPAVAEEVTIAADPRGLEVLTAHSVIEPLRWVVFVEQPVEEALAPVRASAQRTALLIVFGIGLAAVMSVLLARRMVRPIQTLQAGAAKIGAGDLGHRIDVRTGDELEALGEQFNQMTTQLRDSYATLERRVVERTRELSEALERQTATAAALTEALDQQTATSEILRVIGQSHTDVQPVFDAIAVSSLRLLRGHSVIVMRCEGNQLQAVSIRGGLPGSEASAREAIRAIARRRGTYVWDAIFDQEVKQIVDVEQEAWDPIVRAAARARGWRANLAVPMLQGGEPIGLITVSRAEPGRFSSQEVELLKTFADQAVIAIENVRLFKELEARNAALTEALSQQTATSDILKVISQSPTDLQPVFEAILENAARLCTAEHGILFLYDGDVYRAAAIRSGTPAFVEYFDQGPFRATAGSALARLARDPSTVHVADIAGEAAYRERDPLRVATVELGNARTFLAVPMVKDGRLVGAFTIYRTEVRPFSDKQIELVTTFADQAVIAIQNVRLFHELEERTAALTRSVDELQALADVGRAISSTLDLDAVLDAIVSRADQLAGTDAGAIYEYDATAAMFHLRATHNFPDALTAALRSTRLAAGEGAVGQAGLRREPVQFPDIAESVYASRLRDALLAEGHRALLAVPLIAEDEVVGALVVNRRAPGEFPARTVELLSTFATQSALAIQNARLFREIENKSRELEVANRHKSEFLANMSHELRTPLNAIIGFSEVLLERMFGEINDKQEEYLGDILSSGRHLLSLINDILDLSKIEAGRMDLELTAFDLPQAIENALILVRERAARRSIALEQVVAPDLGQVRADERKIKQVLLNLLSNAVKFTPEGGRVEVRAALADGVAEVAVADTGIGIAPEDHEAVFEEFRQVGTDYARKREGTGLGLALARRFVELHGGKIRIESAPGQGSTFTFTIPVEPWPAS